MISITPLEGFLYFILIFLVGFIILVKIANRTQKEQEQKMAATGS